jgi:hypothetical protein
LLAAPADFKELEAFFSTHFDTQSFTKDEMGFPVAQFECPKGSMFVRDENGNLKEST